MTWQIFSRYVPVHESTASVDVHGSCLHIDDSKLVNILLFGDQLTTVACAQGAMQLQDDDNASLHSLEGFVPAIADQDTRMCLLQVHTYYQLRVVRTLDTTLLVYHIILSGHLKTIIQKKSACERGTLYPLRNLVNRTAVKSDPSQCMKAAEDIFSQLYSMHVKWQPPEKSWQIVLMYHHVLMLLNKQLGNT